jgi:hypothetical protein
VFRLPVRVVRSAREQLEYEETIVADLRSSSGRYPGDHRLAQLIADLRAQRGMSGPRLA